MRKYNLISSLFWLTSAVLIIIGSLRLFVGTITNPGPGFFPLIIGCLLGMTSVVLFIFAIQEGHVVKKPFWVNQRKWYVVVTTILSLLIYTTLLPRLGFLVTTFLLLVFLFKVVGELNGIISLGAAILTSVFFYALFQVTLQVELPHGILGI